MSTNTAIQTQTDQQSNCVNGVDLNKINHVVESIEADTTFGQFQFRARNRWINGGLNRSQIKDFHAGGREDATRSKPFTLDGLGD